jgi:hypothetical protein
MMIYLTIIVMVIYAILHIPFVYLKEWYNNIRRLV